jgi:uncharacterized protein Yka (UPF0111/DUF47 family)
MGLQSIVRWLLPKEDHFFDYLEGQAKVAYDAARALHELEDGAAVEDVRGIVQGLEHDGDKLFHELLDALAMTFVTPIDREDLQRLSAELDDILDLTNGAVRAASLFGVKELSRPMSELIELLCSATRIINEAMPLLRRHDYKRLTEAMGEIRKLEKDGDIVFRQAISELFQDEKVDAKKLLREREVLDDLETAIDHCDRVAATLTNLAVKHG